MILASRERERPDYLVPKLCLGTHCLEALLRGAEFPQSVSDDSLLAKQSFASSAFPSRAWERGTKIHDP